MSLRDLAEQWTDASAGRVSLSGFQLRVRPKFRAPDRNQAELLRVLMGTQAGAMAVALEVPNVLDSSISSMEDPTGYDIDFVDDVRAILTFADRGAPSAMMYVWQPSADGTERGMLRLYQEGVARASILLLVRGIAGEPGRAEPGGDIVTAWVPDAWPSPRGMADARFVASVLAPTPKLPMVPGFSPPQVYAMVQPASQFVIQPFAPPQPSAVSGAWWEGGGSGGGSGGAGASGGGSGGAGASGAGASAGATRTPPAPSTPPTPPASRFSMS